MALNKIAIFLRKDKRVNRFREVILSTFQSPDVSEMILCSGFFQEDKHFKASKDFKNIGPSNQKTIKLVGIYNYSWRRSYNNFHQGIIAQNSPSHLTALRYRISGMRWHAKVMIGKQQNTPIIATIGSSNMTGRAFGINRIFNYESDVIIWDDSIQSINEAIDKSIETNPDNNGEVIISNYDPDDWRNGSLSLNEKVTTLEEEIFRRATLE